MVQDALFDNFVGNLAAAKRRMPRAAVVEAAMLRQASIERSFGGLEHPGIRSALRRNVA